MAQQHHAGMPRRLTTLSITGRAALHRVWHGETAAYGCDGNMRSVAPDGGRAQHIYV